MRLGVTVFFQKEKPDTKIVTKSDRNEISEKFKRLLGGQGLSFRTDDSRR